jgi:hypothetical protein
MVKKLVMVLAVAAAAGCASSTAEPEGIDSAATIVAVGDTITLRFGDAVSVAQSGLRVQFRAVKGDSRCPIDAVCVWEGDAHVQIAVGDASSAQVYDLHTALEPKEARHDSYRFRLVEVGPARVSTQTPRPADYYIRLVITRS